MLLRRAISGAVLAVLLAPFDQIALAQNADGSHTPESYGHWIVDSFNTIQRAFYDAETQQQYDDVWKRSIALNDDVDPWADFMGDEISYWYPDLLMARLGVRLKRFEDAAAAAAPMWVGLDSDLHRFSEARVEAGFLLSRALYGLRRYAEAETALRAYLALTAHPDVTPSAQQVFEADYMLAQTSVRTNAPDAAEIRKRLLDGFLDRKGASPNLYLMLWETDLTTRRAQDISGKGLLEDARHVAGFMAAQPDLDFDRFGDLYGQVARIFADHGEFEQSIEMLEARLAYLSALPRRTSDYFFALQNLAGLRNMQEDFAGAMALAQTAIAELDTLTHGDDEEFATVRSALEETVYAAAARLGNTPLSQQALQRAYAAARITKSANDPEVIEMAAKMDRDMIDPDTFVYAGELSLEQPEDLDLSETGQSVISAFFAGDYADTGRQLEQLADGSAGQGVPPGLIAINRAFYHALLGEVGPAADQLRVARQVIRRPAMGVDHATELRANSIAPDLAEALLYSYSRDWKAELAMDPLDRLEQRTDLDPLTRAAIRMMRANALWNMGDNAAAWQVYASHKADDFALVDASPWGTLLGIGLLNLALVLDDLEHARSFGALFSEQMEAAPDRGLALVSAQMFALNADPDAMLGDHGFQTMAFHLRSLGFYLPDEHQWGIAARVAYASALTQRGNFEASADVYAQAIKSYRKSPWHRADAAAIIEVSQAWNQWSAGNIAVAQTMLAQTYSALDLDTWSGQFWSAVVYGHAYSLLFQGRHATALEVLDNAIAHSAAMARLSPAGVAELHQLRGSALSQMQRSDDARVAFDASIDAIPYDDYQSGLTMAQALYMRAAYLFDVADYRQAYTDMTKSNGLWFDRYESQSGDVTRNAMTDRRRALDQAVYGWVLAQQLQGIERE